MVFAMYASATLLSHHFQPFMISASMPLRCELACLDIPVITIRPGAVKTEMEKGAEVAFTSFLSRTKLYKTQLEKMLPLLENNTKNAKPASVIAKVTMRALEDKNPRIIYRSNHNMGMKILSAMPLFLQDIVYRNMLQ